MIEAMIKRVEQHLQLVSEYDPALADEITAILVRLYGGDDSAVADAKRYVGDTRYALTDCPSHHLHEHGVTEVFEPTFYCGISTAFEDKHLLDGHTQAAYGDSFYPRQATAQQLIQHIESGGAFTMGAFKNNQRTKTNFVSAQLLGLDLDDGVSVAECINNTLICDYAAITYPTPSSTPEKPKTRVIWVLSEPVHDLATWELMQRGMIAHFAHLRPDEKCKDASRLFFGSTLPGADTAPRLTLPIQIAWALAGDYQQRENQRVELRKRETEMKRQSFDGHSVDKYLQAAYDDEMLTLRTTPQGGRNNQLFKSACNLYSFVKGGWPVARGGVESDLLSAGLGLGLREHEINATLESAWRSADARPFENNAQA